MAKDPHDPGTRPMPGMSQPDKLRQATLRDRRRRAGLLQRTYWVTPDQDKQIKAFLAEGSTSALTLTPSERR